MVLEICAYGLLYFIIVWCIIYYLIFVFINLNFLLLSVKLGFLLLVLKSKVFISMILSITVFYFYFINFKPEFIVTCFQGCLLMFVNVKAVRCIIMLFSWDLSNFLVQVIGDINCPFRTAFIVARDFWWVFFSFLFHSRNS